MLSRYHSLSLQRIKINTMLNTITKAINKIFGNKSERDIKAIQGYVDNANKCYEEYKQLSFDKLRNKTDDFRKRVLEALSEIDKEIQSLKDSVSSIKDRF